MFMLQKLSEQARECHERAAEANRKAEATDNPAWKAAFLEMEQRGLALARSYEFSERLGDFTAEDSRRLQKLDEQLQVSASRNDAPQHRSVEAGGESEERYRWLASIIEFSDDAIVSKDLNGIITSWNKGAERIFGYLAEEVIGKPITILIPPDRHNEEPAILQRIRRGERIEHYETVRQRKDGSFIAISLTVSPIKDAQGKIVGASKIGRDITERKRSEELIATLAREAEHRTRNVLATVQAAIHLSQADTPDGLKQVIEGRIQALANVNALVVESRWAGAELSALAAQELAAYLEGDDARVRIDGPQLLLTPFVAQAIAMTLHELATNAAKYGALSVDEGHVELRWSLSTDGQLVLDWSETAGPPVTTPKRQGFGTRMIEQMITNQLKGTIRLDWRADGLACEIAFPFSAQQKS
jgi:PAS domain S-box-containing protein